MDELPDLRSDADVDALMARLRARIDATPTAAPATPATGGSMAGPLPDGIAELVAAQDAFASTVVLAMELMIDTLEEVTADAGAAPVSRRRARQTHVARRRAR